MMRFWLTVCLLWQGSSSFLLHNTLDRRCLQDSNPHAEVLLHSCSVDSELQQWAWSEGRFLVNLHTQRCLSALDTDRIRTAECDGGDELHWGCENHRLISLNRSLQLSTHGGRLLLSNNDKNSHWKSLDQGDVCQEKLRARRQRDVYETPEASDSMTEEQKEYLRWYYRTEDPTAWKFAMLGLSLVALLLGCVLCVMDMMSNKHRRKLAAYKLAASSKRMENEELQVITEVKEENSYPSYTAAIQDGHPNNTAPGPSETTSLKTGDIMVTWRDGNVSSLYPESPEQQEET